MDDVTNNGPARKHSLEHLTTIVARGDNWFVAHCLELGVVSQGRTENEARENLNLAVASYLDHNGQNELAG